MNFGNFSSGAAGGIFRNAGQNLNQGQQSAQPNQAPAAQHLPNTFGGAMGALGGGSNIGQHLPNTFDGAMNSLRWGNSGVPQTPQPIGSNGQMGQTDAMRAMIMRALMGGR